MYEIISRGPWVGTPTILVYNPKGELLAAQPGAVPTELIEEFIEQNMAESMSGQEKANQTADKPK